MTISKSYTVFLAFPFDAAIKPLYERTLKSLKKKYGHRLKFIYGNSSVIPPCPVFDTIELFKSQNVDLFNQFYRNIRRSDIVVADLTHNNPNVHVELGIAISMNKNILRLTSRDMTEVGSDMRAYEINRYSSARDLSSRLTSYLDKFLNIKDLPLSKASGPLFREHVFSGMPTTLDGFKDQSIPYRSLDIGARIRDCGISTTFTITNVNDPSDWFGVYLRHGSPNPWAGRSYLVYIRRNGLLELAELPHIRVLGKAQYSELPPDESRILEISIDGSELMASLGSSTENCLRVTDLDLQEPGNIAVGCHKNTVLLETVQTVCRDTIEWV